MKHSPPAILIFREWYDERFVAGVSEVCRTCGWQPYFADRRGSHIWFGQTAFAGGIFLNHGRPLPAELLACINSAEFCAVNGNDAHIPGLRGPQSRVIQDDAAIGRMGARHLHSRGHRDLAFYQFAGTPSHRTRNAAFCQEAQELGCRLHAFIGNPKSGPTWLTTALNGLPEPLAVMTDNDDAAVALCQSCHAHEILVPEQLAILGIENDSLLCMNNDPPLSSIDTNNVEWGRQCALHLDRLLRGLTPPQKPVIIQPVGVIHRRSSERSVLGHAAVAKAVELLRSHRHERHLNVGELLSRSGMSRASLYRVFAKRIGHSPMEELRRLRLEDACHLLTNTTHGLNAIAEQCGFSDASHLCRLFLQHYATSPSDFRRRHQGPQSQSDRLRTQ